MPQTDLDGVDGVFDQFIKCAILKIPKKAIDGVFDQFT